MFSHSVGCLLILLTVSFAVQDLFILVQSHLFIFAFVACAFVIITKKDVVRTNAKKFFPMLSSCFTVAGLTFKPNPFQPNFCE